MSQRVQGGQKTTKSSPQNNALTLPKQLKNNFEKVQKSTFSTPKMDKTRMSIWPKSVDFWVHCRPTSSTLGLLVMKKKLKSFALIAKHI